MLSDIQLELYIKSCRRARAFALSMDSFSQDVYATKLVARHSYKNSHAAAAKYNLLDHTLLEHLFSLSRNVSGLNQHSGDITGGEARYSWRISYYNRTLFRSENRWGLSQITYNFKSGDNLLIPNLVLSSIENAVRKELFVQSPKLAVENLTSSVYKSV